MPDDFPEPQLVHKMDDPPVHAWVYGYAVCRECCSGPPGGGHWWYWIDRRGRCYCVECAPPLQPAGGGGRQTVLCEIARLDGRPPQRRGGGER